MKCSSFHCLDGHNRDLSTRILFSHGDLLCSISIVDHKNLQFHFDAEMTNDTLSLN